MIDFVPGGKLPMHRVQSLDYAVVIEGIFSVVLDSGEERVLQRGDSIIQRSTTHEWTNVSGEGQLPGRVLFVMLDTKDFQVASEVNMFQGEVGMDYIGLPRQIEIQSPVIKQG